MNIDRQREISDSNDPRNPDNWDDNNLDDNRVNVLIYEVPGKNSLLLTLSDSNGEIIYSDDNCSYAQALDWLVPIGEPLTLEKVDYDATIRPRTTKQSNKQLLVEKYYDGNIGIAKRRPFTEDGKKIIASIITLMEKE